MLSGWSKLSSRSLALLDELCTRSSSCEPAWIAGGGGDGGDDGDCPRLRQRPKAALICCCSPVMLPISAGKVRETKRD